MKKTVCILIALVMLAGLISFPASSLAEESPVRVLLSAESRDALTILNDPTDEMIANAVTGVLCKDDVSLRKGPGPDHSAVKRGLDIGALRRRAITTSATKRAASMVTFPWTPWSFSERPWTHLKDR